MTKETYCLGPLEWERLNDGYQPIAMLKNELSDHSFHLKIKTDDFTLEIYHSTLEIFVSTKRKYND